MRSLWKYCILHIALCCFSVLLLCSCSRFPHIPWHNFAAPLQLLPSTPQSQVYNPHFVSSSLKSLWKRWMHAASRCCSDTRAFSCSVYAMTWSRSAQTSSTISCRAATMVSCTCGVDAAEGVGSSVLVWICPGCRQLRVGVDAAGLWTAACSCGWLGLQLQRYSCMYNKEREYVP